MPAPLTPPLTDAELNEIGANPPVMGGWPAGRLLADDRRLRAELAVARAEIERLRTNFAGYLQPAYAANPVSVARLCDEKLDQTGQLLGMLRAALAPEGKEGG